MGLSGAMGAWQAIELWFFSRWCWQQTAITQLSEIPRNGIPPKVEGSFRSTMGLSSQDGPSLPVRRSVMASQPSCPAAVGIASFLSLSQGLDEAVLRTISNARTPPTHVNHGQKWRVFSSSCSNRQEDQATCSIQLVLCFL